MKSRYIAIGYPIRQMNLGMKWTLLTKSLWMKWVSNIACAPAALWFVSDGRCHRRYEIAYSRMTDIHSSVRCDASWYSRTRILSSSWWMSFSNILWIILRRIGRSTSGLVPGLAAGDSRRLFQQGLGVERSRNRSLPWARSEVSPLT